MKVVVFKSVPDNWNKESRDIKMNTVRVDDGGIRFQMLREWIKFKEYGHIVLVNTETLEATIKCISDITPFKEDEYIISWR